MGSRERKRVLYFGNFGGTKLKTETTKKLEELLRAKFNSRNEFYVFECTIRLVWK